MKFFIDYPKTGKNIIREYHMALFYWLIKEKKKMTSLNTKGKSAVPPRKFTLPQVNENDGQIEWKARLITLPHTI